MSSEDKLYRDLQIHLDKQAVGFPATESGVEIRILKELFNPEEARLSLHLSYKPQSAADVHNSVKDSGISQEEVEGMLKAMVDNGAIGEMERNGIDYYYTIPLLVGIAELHSSKASPQFRADLGEYFSKGFLKAFASTKVSQMRTIPVEKSIKVEHNVTTYDHAREIINNTEGPIAITTCMCREGEKGRGEPCQKTSRQETCMGLGDWAKRFIEAGLSREITREEALEIIRQNEEDGLVLQPNNYQKLDFLCACCGCCCGILKIHQSLPKPAETWAHNYYAAVDTEICRGCGICVKRCQVNAATIDEETGRAAINLDRCIGCGNCVVTCPAEARRLVKMEKEKVPPDDRTGLYELLAERKA